MLVRGRFAPSPSGRMHLGNIYAALVSWLSVRKKNGIWLLRIEDLDRQRCKKQYAELIMDDLHWLGLDWDEGPFFQSERDAIYLNAFQKLKEKNLLYECFCRRGDLLASSAPHEGERAVYSGKCRLLTDAQKKELMLTRSPAWRIKVPEEDISFCDGHYGLQVMNLKTDCGDFVLRRADGNFSYQLAVVVDDALMEVTEVVRGMDLISSTPQQIFLYGKLGYSCPEFFHIPLMVNGEGKRLCKRDSDCAMDVLRANFTPEEIIGKIMHYAGFIPEFEPLSASDAVKFFDWKALSGTNLGVKDNLYP